MLERTREQTLLGWDLGADSSHISSLYCDHDSTIVMDGREVFKVAVKAVSNSVSTALKRAALDSSDVDVLLSHQANIRIIEAICKKNGYRFRQEHQCDRAHWQQLFGDYSAVDGQSTRMRCSETWSHRAHGPASVQG